MIQTFDCQLQVVLRALGDVVAPALADADKHVVEQLQLSIATLSFIALRLPDARRFHRYELGAYLDLAEALAAVVNGDRLRATVADGRALLERADADVADYEAATRQCREQVTDLSNAAEGTAHQAAVDTIILDRSEPIVQQARQWCAPFGFELKPGELSPPAW